MAAADKSFEPKPPVGLAVHKTRLPALASRLDRINRTRAMMSRVLNLGTTVAFVGAGCSAPRGYPTWDGFAHSFIGECLRKLEGTYHARRLTELHAEMIGTEGPSRLQFVLGFCKAAFEAEMRTSEYYDTLKSFFSAPTLPVQQHDPYENLLQLPIQRFITSNYDDQLEVAIARKLKIDFSNVQSFTPDSPDQLSLFSLARTGTKEHAVFHCHGTWRQPQEMVVTESDYQRVYLADENLGFRETLDLLLTSNPIIFVGFGLGDDDLLRPLRAFSTLDSTHKAEHPLFAILPELEDGSQWTYHEELFERYGIHVLPYVTDVDGRAQSLCYTLAHIRENWLADRDEWLKKPPFRKVTSPARPPAPYHHYFTDRARSAFVSDRDKKLLEILVTPEKPKVLALVGPGGTGKSWLAMWLLETLRKTHAGSFEAFFLWSSYYSDDALTGLDQALRYLEGERPRKGSRLDRLRACLCDRRAFLVFDGVERFLRETDTPEIGKIYNPDVKRFFEQIVMPESKSTVLITSRLWPDCLGEPLRPLEGVIRHPVPRLTADDVRADVSFEASRTYPW